MPQNQAVTLDVGYEPVDMVIAVCDRAVGGHHDLYLFQASEALAEAGHTVWIVSPAAEKTRVALVDMSPALASQFLAVPLLPKHPLEAQSRAQLSAVGRWLTLRNALRRAAREHKVEPDFVFHLFIDEYLAPLLPHAGLDALFPYRWGAIYMQPLFRLQETPAGKRRGLLRRDNLLQARRFRGSMPLDEVAAPWLEKLTEKLSLPSIEFGDVAEPDFQDPLVATVRAAANGRPIIALVGALAKRKGVLTFLEAALKSPESLFFVLAGKFASSEFNESERDFIESCKSTLADRAFFSLEPISTDGAFSALVASSAVVYAAYQDWPFSSGIQTMAAEFGRPCVVGNEGIMADRATSYGTGLTIDPTNAKEAAEAIESLLTTPLPKAGFEAFREKFTRQNFRDRIVEFVTEATRRV